MSSTEQNRLWRVEWFHRSGYRAPSTYVEAKTRKEAINIAKEASRLGDFPKSWSVRLKRLGTLRSNGKWVPDVDPLSFHLLLWERAITLKCEDYFS